MSTSFAQSDTVLVCGCFDTFIHIWDADYGTVRRIMRTPSRVWSVAASNSGLFAAACEDCVVIGDVANGTVLRKIPGGSEAVTFTHDGEGLLIGWKFTKGLSHWAVASSRSGITEEDSSSTLSGPQVGTSLMMVYRPIHPSLLLAGAHRFAFGIV